MNRILYGLFQNYLIGVAKILATGFGSGYLPKAPGTWGSIMALPIAYAITFWANAELLASLIFIFFLIGIWASNITSKKMGDSDPSQIVIDEVVGQWFTLLVVPPNIVFYLIGFLLFRLFDIFKPWPITWIDKNIKGGLGIMLDDVFAAIYAAFFLWLFKIAFQDFI